MEPPATYTFAQITDPHLTSLAGARFGQLLNKRILGYLSWRKRRRAEHQVNALNCLVDDLKSSDARHLVVTGDLTHIGLPEEFEQAATWLRETGKPGDVTVIPGNHETYVASPWNATFDRWTDYMVSDAGGSRDATMFPTLRTRGPVAIIGVNSSVPTAPFLATGTVDPAQLESLEALLKQTGEQGLFRLVLVHHTPVAGVDKWRKRLTNQRALRTVLDSAGAELVLHGHTHRSVWTELDTSHGKIPVISPPSGSAVCHRPERVARYHLYRVERVAEGWNLEVEVRAYSPGDGTVYQDGVRQLQLLRS